MPPHTAEPQSNVNPRMTVASLLTRENPFKMRDPRMNSTHPYRPPCSTRGVKTVRTKISNIPVSEHSCTPFPSCTIMTLSHTYRMIVLVNSAPACTPYPPYKMLTTLCRTIYPMYFYFFGSDRALMEAFSMSAKRAMSLSSRHLPCPM